MDSSIAQYRIKKVTQGIKNSLIANTTLPLIPAHDLTLNHKYGVQQNVPPLQKPTIAYVGFGNNGCYNVDDGMLSSPRSIKNDNKDLYRPMPIRCVPVDEDVSPAEREFLRMRVRETHHGQDFYCYYLTPIIFTSNVIMTKTNPDTLEEEPYEEDPNGLTPTPPIESGSGTIISGDNEVNVSLLGYVEATGAQLLEGARIIYGDERYAAISELGLFTGEDMVVTGESPTGQIQYTEAIYAQLAVHSTFISMPMLSPSSYKKFDISLGKDSVMLL